MKKIISKYLDKLFFKKWIIGICRDNIKEIIRNKTFNPDINWLRMESFEKFYADPFLLTAKDGNFKIMFEDFAFNDGYGKISLMTLDENFTQIDHKILLDTKSHLSYPFVFTENNKTYVFPESAQMDKLSCYEYDPVNETLTFLKDILDLPLRDSTILKHNDKYWIFGTLSNNGEDYELNVFFADSLLGTYTPHPGNPLKNGLNGTRSAGNFIEVDGVIYRPTQNCQKFYGESITINKVTEFNEINFVEEPFMTINLNTKRKCNYGIRSIHTINIIDNVFVVDGEHWIFSPMNQVKIFLKSRKKKRSKIT